MQMISHVAASASLWLANWKWLFSIHSSISSQDVLKHHRIKARIKLNHNWLTFCFYGYNKPWQVTALLCCSRSDDLNQCFILISGLITTAASYQHINIWMYFFMLNTFSKFKMTAVLLMLVKHRPTEHGCKTTQSVHLHLHTGTQTTHF